MGWRDFFTTRPLVVLALLVVVGVLLGRCLPGTWWMWWVLLVLGGILLAASFFSPRARAGTICGLASVTFAVSMLGSRLQTESHPLRWFLEARPPSDSLTVVANGRIEKALRRDLPGTHAHEEYFIASEVVAPTLGRRWHGQTRLRVVTGREDNLPPGQYQLTGFLRLPRPADNPGQFDERAYDLRLGLVAELRAMEWQCLSADAWNLESFLVRKAGECRAWIEHALAHELENAPREYAVIVAMVLGTVNAGSADLQTPFRESGTLHIFSVSGLHVAIVGLILWQFLKPLALPRGQLLLVLIPVLFGYAFITGLRPSAVRAAVMAAVFLCGASFLRKGDLLNSLGAAALLLLAWDPRQLFSPGFQLSFAVLAAIALLSKAIQRPLHRLVEPDPFLPKALLTPPQRWWWRGKQHVAGLFAVSAAAWVGSLPLILGHFHLVTPVALVANIVLVPLSFCVLFTALLTLLGAALHLTLAQALFSNANYLLASLTLKSAIFFAEVPGGNFRVPQPFFEKSPPAEFTVLRLPQGGAAQHLRVGSQHWLLDAGSAKDIPYLLEPYFEHRAITRFHAVILSHNDIAHVGAASELRKKRPIPICYLPATEPWRWDGSNTTLKKVPLEPWACLHLPWGDRLNLGDAPSFTASAKVLYPSPETSERRADDRALIVRLDLGPFRILWTGDSGFLAEKAVLASHSPDMLRAHVLVRNRHATDTSFLPEWVRTVAPEVVIASNQSFPAGQDIPDSVRKTCEALGVKLLDQATTGAVRLKAWPDRLEITPYHAPDQGIVLHGTPPARGG